MGEGFGDYWAADQSAPAPARAVPAGVPRRLGLDLVLDRRRSACAGSTATKHYPEDMDGEVHDDGEMWSASLWQIRSAVGRTVANREILEAHFLLTPVPKFPAGAKAIIAADRSLYGGAHVAKITQIFDGAASSSRPDGRLGGVPDVELTRGAPSRPSR